MVSRIRDIDAFLNQAAEIHLRKFAPSPPVSGAACFQHLLNRTQQPVAIQQHESVKVTPLLFVYLSPLQGFQIESNRSDGSLQFVRNGIDEAIVLLVATNLAYQEDGVQDEPGSNSAEEDDAQEDLQTLPPVQDDPAETD